MDQHAGWAGRGRKVQGNETMDNVLSAEQARADPPICVVITIC